MPEIEKLNWTPPDAALYTSNMLLSFCVYDEVSS
jgi:hypothetical protein